MIPIAQCPIVLLMEQKYKTQRIAEPIAGYVTYRTGHHFGTPQQNKAQ